METSRDSEAHIAALVDRFEHFCTEEGLRTSSARRKIVEVIVQDLAHFTAVDLLARLSKRYPEVGRATLYRTIPFLVKAGILQEGPKTIDGHPSYELAETQHHDHIVCLDCQEIFEFESPRIEREQDRIAADLGFRPESHNHVVYARCARLERNRAK